MGRYGLRVDAREKRDFMSADLLRKSADDLIMKADIHPDNFERAFTSDASQRFPAEPLLFRRRRWACSGFVLACPVLFGHRVTHLR